MPVISYRLEHAGHWSTHQVIKPCDSSPSSGSHGIGSFTGQSVATGASRTHFCQIRRVQASRYVDALVVATTTDPADDPIVEMCIGEEIICFRGHPTDLLDRHYQAAYWFRPMPSSTSC
ncbi:MAG: hypothetical protein IPL78_16045 [Chloroflexi bacterium]|nr:hypothetical protein [Chloroflexota bacterium]